MASCGSCGRDNPEGMRFCTNCGATLPDVNAPFTGSQDSSSVETLSFRADPQTSPPNWPNIGNAYRTTAPPVSEPKSRTGLIIGIIAAVFLLGIILTGVGVGYYYYSGSTRIPLRAMTTREFTRLRQSTIRMTIRMLTRTRRQRLPLLRRLHKCSSRRRYQLRTRVSRSMPTEIGNCLQLLSCLWNSTGLLLKV